MRPVECCAVRRPNHLLTSPQRQQSAFLLVEPTVRLLRAVGDEVKYNTGPDDSKGSSEEVHRLPRSDKFGALGEPEVDDAGDHGEDSGG